MPIDYKNYPKDWKTKIRPDILDRADDKCEQCKVENKSAVLRGFWNDKPVYQDMDGFIYDASNGEEISSNYLGDIDKCNNGTKIVLTIAHLDHDITNNEHSNLKALCQRCHLYLDLENHIKKAKETRAKNKKQIEIF